MKQIIRNNKRKWIVLSLFTGIMVIGLGISSSNLEAFTIDQRNDSFPQLDSFNHSIQIYSPIGQEFTPTFSSLNVVELMTLDFDRGTHIGANLFVNIRSWNIFGLILGTSSIVSLPDGFGDPDGAVTHFDFPILVPLIPGQTYVIEAVVQSGENWGVHNWGGPNDTYPSGRMIREGNPIPLADLWFREGVEIVPEPTTMLLLGSGLIGLWGARRKFKK